jgi:hypothetical protein
MCVIIYSKTQALRTLRKRHQQSKRPRCSRLQDIFMYRGQWWRTDDFEVETCCYRYQGWLSRAYKRRQNICRSRTWCRILHSSQEQMRHQAEVLVDFVVDGKGPGIWMGVRSLEEKGESNFHGLWSWWYHVQGIRRCSSQKQGFQLVRCWPGGTFWTGEVEVHFTPLETTGETYIISARKKINWEERVKLVSWLDIDPAMKR